MEHMVKGGWLRGLVVLGGVLAVQWGLSKLWRPAPTAWLGAPVYFLVAKLTGDAGEWLVGRTPPEVSFFEDWAKETLAYLVLGLIAALAMATAAPWAGAALSPAIPAVGGFIVLHYATARKRD